MSSTEPVLRTTPSAPNASAQRTTVPALPGSRTCTQQTTRREPARTTSASGDVDPAADGDDALRGDGVGERREVAPGELVRLDADVGGHGHQLGEPGGGGRVDVEVGDDTGAQGLANGLRALDEEEPGRLTLLAALETTGPRTRSDQGVPQAAVVAGTSAGAAALATATSAANAGASDTASSARILRSTSTPAVLRPEMKRL